VLRLLAVGAVTVAEVEQAAVPIPARTNGGAEPEPLASLEEAPEQSALARAKTAALADSGLTIAEKVIALAANACRWPYGDPQRPGFHFCGNSVVREPYCEQHRVAAYVARSLSEARPGFRCSPPAPPAESGEQHFTETPIKSAHLHALPDTDITR